MARRVTRRRNLRKKPRPFGSVRVARPSREYVRIPVLRRKNLKRVQYGARINTSGMPHCTRLFAKSILDPSGEGSKGACLPCGFPMPSQKMRVFTRGFMYAQNNNTTPATSTANVGFITWRPVLAGDVSCLTYTTSASPSGAVGTATAFNSGNWAVASQNMTKIPYLAAAFTAGTVQGRLVSGCLRIRYADQEDVRAGVVSLFEDPDHLSLAASTIAAISDFDSCGKERPSGDGHWHQINWSGPAKQSETEYVTNDGAAVPTSGAFTTACVVIAVNGAFPVVAGAGSGIRATQFEFECWQNLEYIGRDVVGKTNNQLDEQGAKTVFGAAKTAQSQDHPLNPDSPAATVFRDILRNATSTTTSSSTTGTPRRRGPTATGNFFQAVATALHPGFGRAWGIGRAFLQARRADRGD